MILFILELTAAVLLLIPVGLNAYIPFYFIEGNSMLPTYHPRNIVLIHNWPAKNPQALLGQVIVFFNPEKRKIIVHRVVGINGNAFITKGDHNAKQDTFEPTSEQMLGVVWLKI